MDTNHKLTDHDVQVLSTCDPQLIQLIMEVSKVFPIMVITGFRGEAEQTAAYRSGTSRTKWPMSKHNRVPARAVDISPLPYDGKNTRRLLYLAGYVRGVASVLGVPIRCGADWNSNFNPSDETFTDLFHFELADG